MANYLVAKCGNTTSSYSLRSTEPSKPYLRVSNSYLPLTTSTKTGLQVKVNGNNYNIQESYTTSITKISTYNVASTSYWSKAYTVYTYKYRTVAMACTNYSISKHIKFAMYSWTITMSMYNYYNDEVSLQFLMSDNNVLSCRLYTNYYGSSSTIATTSSYYGTNTNVIFSLINTRCTFGYNNSQYYQWSTVSNATYNYPNVVATFYTTTLTKTTSYTSANGYLPVTYNKTYTNSYTTSTSTQ